MPVETGDLIFVDAGTVHAIWPGSILLETQQNCDITYRMYDYGRGRELHIEKSLEATQLTTRAGKIAPQELADRTVLIDSEYFRVERITCGGQPHEREPSRCVRSPVWLTCLPRRERGGLRAQNSSRWSCRRAALWPCRRPRPSSCWKIWALRKGNSI